MNRYKNRSRVHCIAAPVLSTVEAVNFISHCQKPEGCNYVEVPAGKLIRSDGFWLAPDMPSHPVAKLFLISRECLAATPGDTSKVNVLLFFSSDARSLYLGTVTEVESGEYVLTPLTKGLHPDLPLQGLTLIGLVIAAM